MISRRHLLAVILAAVVSLAAPVPAGAGSPQHPTSPEPAALALAESDLPGFELLDEQALPGAPLFETRAPVFEAGVQRDFVADGLRIRYPKVLIERLRVANPSTPLDSLQRVVASGAAFDRYPGARDVRLTGPRGIGDADQSARWTGWNEIDDAWETYYGESFVSGRVVVELIYSSESNALDPGQLTEYAQVQLSKLQRMLIGDVGAAGVQTGGLSSTEACCP